MRGMFVIGALAIGLLLSFCLGCNRLIEEATEKATEKAIEKASGGDVDVDLNQGGMTVKSKDGNATSQYGPGAKLPDGWPAEFPQYPGSTIIGSNSVSNEDGIYTSVTMTTKDPVDQVTQFYEGKASSAGYKQTSMYSSEDMINKQYTGPDHILTLAVGKGDDETSINLAFQPNPDAGGDSGESEGEEAAGDGSGDADSGSVAISDTTGNIPDGFPVQVLKPYTNGKVTMASMNGTDHILVQETADSPAQVVEFYDNHLTGRGWSIESKVEVQGTTMRSYKSSGGEIMLSVGEDSGTTQITLNYSAKK